MARLTRFVIPGQPRHVIVRGNKHNHGHKMAFECQTKIRNFPDKFASSISTNLIILT